MLMFVIFEHLEEDNWQIIAKTFQEIKVYFPA